MQAGDSDCKSAATGEVKSQWLFTIAKGRKHPLRMLRSQRPLRRFEHCGKEHRQNMKRVCLNVGTLFFITKAIIPSNLRYRTKNERNYFMTTAQQVTMNTELWQSIGAIADNEALMRRLTRYAKKLAKEKDPTLMTKEEFFARVDEARREYDEGKYHTFDSIEDLDRYIRSL